MNTLLNVDDDDKLVNEELKKIDDIYEGGEREEVLVDPDDEEEVDSKRVRVIYSEVKDWREEFTVWQAFTKGHLRKNDYHVIYSALLSISVLIIGAWLICADNKSYLGITIAVPVLHYALAAFSHLRTLSTEEEMTPLEYFCFFLAYIIQFGWGILNLNLSYGFF